MTWLAGILLWTVQAWATEFYFEGPITAERSVAVAATRQARAAELEARVVRRYKEGEGWEYVVRVTGFTDEAAASAQASRIADLLGGDVSLFAQASPDADPVAVKLARAAGARSSSDGGEVIVSPLQPTIDAHGGTAGGSAAIDAAKQVLFRYRRTLPDGLVVDHLWARSGNDVFVKIAIASGEGQPSRTLVTGDGAWLAVGDGPLQPQDRERTIETVEALGPTRVVPFVLAFAAVAAERKEFEEIRLEGNGEVDGSPVRVLRADGDQASGALTVEVDASTSLVRRVTFEDGVLVQQFDGWPDPSSGAVRLPKMVRTWRDGDLADTVEILEFSLSPELPKTWFQAP